METLGSLKNHFLIAMPGLDDPFFERSVTYICEHNDNGAMGLIINHPVEISVEDLLAKVEIIVPLTNQQLGKPVYAGGPLARDRGFVLHTADLQWRNSIILSDDLAITTSKDILKDIGQGLTPNDFLLTLGYSGWEAGQLESELAENSWLIIPADNDILFRTPSNQRWQKALNKLGIEPWQLVADVGHS